MLPNVSAANAQESAANDSELRYRRLFESARDGILILDAASGRIDDVNPCLADILGYARAEFIGKHVWEFAPFKEVFPTREAFSALQENDYVAHEDMPLEAFDGRIIDVGLVCNAYLVEEKRIIQCNIRDITSKKLAEKSRLNLEAQIRASQKMDAIGGLAGGIAHDFNNLLSVILCYTKFAMEGLQDGDPVRDDLHEVEKASARAADLTRQLLAFSRKQVLRPVPLDLNQVASGLEKMLRRILGEDIDFLFVLDPNLRLTLADPGQIEQVLMNLVVNARDAMPMGGKLTIETANIELDEDYAATHMSVKPGAYVMIAVADTGTGMDAETKGRVFEPFFTTKEPGKGTGLGLSTVYGIVKQSGGNIWVYSELGYGTTFKIYLPCDRMVVTADAKTSTSPSPSIQVGTETLLVVEDEETVRKVAQRILLAAGYTVLMASNGKEALRLCESYEGDIANVCRDVDGDSCDDCAITGANGSGGDPANDGLDLNGDGICEFDADGDTIPDDVEGTGDTDGDGIPNYLDTDSDNDGILDRDEAGDNNSATAPIDTDNDGTPDYLDTDSDNDGIPDEIEAGDADEETPAIDTDGDGTPDYRDLDSDNDGLSDAEEAGDDDPSTPPVDTDDDGVPDFQDTDADGDGIDDADDNCPIDANPDQSDSNGDNQGDACQSDSADDQDEDGVPDSQDNCPGASNTTQLDTDGDGQGDVCDEDVDGDGFLNGTSPAGGSGCQAYKGLPSAWMSLLWASIALLLLARRNRQQ